MKQIFFVFVFSCAVNACFGQGLKSFFAPIPKPDEKILPSEGGTDKPWKWRPVVSLPALKLTESTRLNAQVDALLLTSTGGGISIQKSYYDDGDKRWKSTFSWSPATILLSGNLSADNPINISYVTTVGFFNNLLMIGAGYDLGEVSGRSRFFGVLSIGVNFNN